MHTDYMYDGKSKNGFYLVILISGGLLQVNIGRTRGERSNIIAVELRCLKWEQAY